MLTFTISKCTIIELILIAAKICAKAPPNKRFKTKFTMRTDFEAVPTVAAAPASVFALLGLTYYGIDRIVSAFVSFKT